jgi:hypothetical protein
MSQRDSLRGLVAKAAAKASQLTATAAVTIHGQRRGRSDSCFT